MTELEFARNRITARVVGLRRSALIEQLIADCTEIDAAKRPTISHVIEVLREWQRDLHPESYTAFGERIRSAQAFREKEQREGEARRIMKTLEEAADAVQQFLFSHPLNAGLLSTQLTPGPTVGMDGGWWPDTSNATLENPYRVVGFRFNIGDLTLAPLLGIQCGFAIRPGENHICYEIAGAVIDQTGTHYLEKCSGEFVRFDSTAQSKIEKSLRDAMHFLSENVTRVDP